MTTDEILLDVEERMEKAIRKLKGDLAGIRTGRANPGLVDSLRVEVYGSAVPIKQVASVGAPEPNQIAPSRLGAPIVDGRYLFQGVPPGKYRIYAADSTRVTPTSRSAFLAAADTLEVLEGGRVTRNLKAVAQEELNAQPKQ